jgi:hypothetical protein
MYHADRAGSRPRHVPEVARGGARGAAGGGGLCCARIIRGTMKGMRRVAGLALAGTISVVVTFAVLAVIFGRGWSWGGVPDWVTAIGTVGLLAGAVFTAVFAVQAFREQSKEVRLLEDQVSDQRTLALKQVEVLGLQAEEIRASLENRRQDQAARVFTWVEVTSHERGHFLIHVTNSSDRPIYGLTFFLGYGGDEEADYISKPEAVKHVMPHKTTEHDPGDDEHSILWGTSWEPGEVWSAVHFRDASGEAWQVNSKGQLERAPVPGPG